MNHNAKITKLKLRKEFSQLRLSFKGSLSQFKQVNKTFSLINVFNCESSYLIFPVICLGCKKEYIGETGWLVKEQINIYRKHIRQPQYQQLSVEEYLRTCRDGKFRMFPFVKILQENKSLRKYDQDFVIDK